VEDGVRYGLLSVLAAALSVLGWFAAESADPVGNIVALKSLVKGDGKVLAAGEALSAGERIETDATGEAQIQFKDGTKLVVGKNSTLVLDSFVFNDQGSFSNLTLSTITGAFRWISGKSKPSAYSIKTPTGALTVRGTAFDLRILQDGEVAILLQDGRVQFCSSAGICRTLQRICDVVVATSAQNVRHPEAYSSTRLRGLGFEGAFPYLPNNGLLPQFRLTRARCDRPRLPRAPLRTHPHAHRQSSLQAPPSANSSSVSTIDTKAPQNSRTINTGTASASSRTAPSSPSSPSGSNSGSGGSSGGSGGSTGEGNHGNGQGNGNGKGSGEQGNNGHGHNGNGKSSWIAFPSDKPLS
jgi:hypothetical protein